MSRLINDAEFKEANTVFSAMLVHAKKVGKGDVQHKHLLSKEACDTYIHRLIWKHPRDFKIKCS